MGQKGIFKIRWASKREVGRTGNAQGPRNRTLSLKEPKVHVLKSR